jgi:hypothetical protein
MRMTLLICTFMAMVSTTAWAQSSTSKDVDLATLATWMEGRFSSEEQSKADTSFIDVRLAMKRIWHDRTDGYWFIVEQSMAATLDKPYRQRVYHVRRVEENMIESRVYTWKNPSAVVGAWKDTTKLDGMTPDSLTLRRGCEVYLQMDTDVFFGSTHGTACASDLRGASYATSDVRIYPEGIISWDRGYSADGRQVWGATKGGYRFRKLEGW